MGRVTDDLSLGRFTFDGYLHNDGEMEISANGSEETVYAWIDKEDAKALVDHLTKVFNL